MTLETGSIEIVRHRQVPGLEMKLAAAIGSFSQQLRKAGVSTRTSLPGEPVGRAGVTLVLRGDIPQDVLGEVLSAFSLAQKFAPGSPQVRVLFNFRLFELPDQQLEALEYIARLSTELRSRNATVEAIPMNQDTVRQRRQLRQRLLELCWQRSGGIANRALPFAELAAEAGIAESEFLDYHERLVAEGSIEPVAVGQIALTVAAVAQFEDNLTPPPTPKLAGITPLTQHFFGPVGAVQNAPSGTANIVQNVGLATDQILPLLAELRVAVASLTGQARNDAVDLLVDLEEETKAPAPKQSRIKAYLQGLASLLPGTVSSVLGNLVTQYGLSHDFYLQLLGHLPK
jgi:hypothetical protein